jgi:hypothetical protein
MAPSMSLLYLLGAIVVAIILVGLVRAAKRMPHPWMLSIPEHPDWKKLPSPAPIAPELLLTPHKAKKPIRCYEARVHRPSGLRVTVGVFESPLEHEEGAVFVMERLMSDSAELGSSGTQMVSIGRLEGMARTGWINVAGASGPEDGSWGDTIANINWYFPEVSTARVHFASTFIDAEQGQAASNLVHELLAGAGFVQDSGQRIATRALIDHG